jgi:hypothetical protein
MHPLCWLVILATICTTVALRSPQSSAWNGYTPPDLKATGPWTPYYIPLGSQSYGSSSPAVLYTGHWSEAFSSAYVAHAIRRSSSAGATATFTFTGTGIEVFGCMSNRHGVAQIVLDGINVVAVDAWFHGSATLKQQRLFARANLHYGNHTIKVINTGRKHAKSRGTMVDVDAFIVSSLKTDMGKKSSKRNRHGRSGQWTLTQDGITGVHAMQLAVISNTHAIIIDKVEHNPLTIDGHPAWAALFDLRSHTVSPISLQSNSFCAGGSFLGNGTLVNVGGNPVVEDHTSAADFGDVDGLQAIRVLEPCEGDSVQDCHVVEHHTRLRMASPRWYATVIRIDDGSALIVGGSTKGGWTNNATTNNPTIEFFPPKALHGSNGLPVDLPFLRDTLNSNLFPIVFALPDGRIFVAANQDAMIYDYKRNIEHRLPKIPNAVRVTYPMAGTGILLPLDHENEYQPEILLCGGSTVDDKTPSWEISSQDPASSQCSRMVLTDAGTGRGWEVDRMPDARVMPDAVLLPTGKVVILNGAGTGISGYGNVKHQIGTSNADCPVLAQVLYDPTALAGRRFQTKDMPSSPIPRLYHSVATLVPSGEIMIAGSNPNLDRSEVRYGTEYRVEWLQPPYMHVKRPRILSAPSKIAYRQAFHISVLWAHSMKGRWKGT